MNLTRRTLLAGAAGTALNVPFPAFGANGTASRKFSASRGASDAGHQKITLSRSGDVITIDLETRLKVRLLGIPVYRYSLNSREVWEGGVLQRRRERQYRLNLLLYNQSAGSQYLGFDPRGQADQSQDHQKRAGHFGSLERKRALHPLPFRRRAEDPDRRIF